MKKLLTTLYLLLLAAPVLTHGQRIQDKLYYTCRIWGFVKYYHSAVSNCRLNWDSVLLYRYPRIMAAATPAAFNRELDTLLLAAGPMAIDRAPRPALPAAALRRNLDTSWWQSPLLDASVRHALDTIWQRFRPHPSCHHAYNDYRGGSTSYLRFGKDSLIYKNSISSVYPSAPVRMLLISCYWHIIRYFNPYNELLDQSWDSTLYARLPALVQAASAGHFYAAFKQMVAQLNDAHADGFTHNYSIPDTPLHYYGPKIALRYIEGQYTVVRSEVRGVDIGSVIDSVDAVPVKVLATGLSTYISAGNPAVLQRTLCQYLLNGPYGSTRRLAYRDASGKPGTVMTQCSVFDWKGGYYPSDSLSRLQWRRLGCNIGYVHMGNLEKTEIAAMYKGLEKTDALIFDLRNYPRGTLWGLAPVLFPEERAIAVFRRPLLDFPGTFALDTVKLGRAGNKRSYKGRVIILADEQTQSQAEYTCMGLKAMDKAIVVGSQTAGTDGNIVYFQLSQDLKTGFTGLGTFYPDGSGTQRVGIVPDYLVLPTRAGIIAGRDEVLEQALRLAGCPPQPAE